MIVNTHCCSEPCFGDNDRIERSLETARRRHEADSTDGSQTTNGVGV